MLWSFRYLKKIITTKARRARRNKTSCSSCLRGE